MKFVPTRSEDAVEEYHTVFEEEIGMLVRLASAHVSSTMTTARLADVSPKRANDNEKIRITFFIGILNLVRFAGRRAATPGLFCTTSAALDGREVPFQFHPRAANFRLSLPPNHWTVTCPHCKRI
jgi:hypothetical protein